MSSRQQYEFTGNGATARTNFHVESLDYRAVNKATKRLNVNFDQFASSLVHVPVRILDLLELASYVFAVDRLVNRGKSDALEYHSWAREITLSIKVRDYEFWNDTLVKDKLSECLEFVTGDRSWDFFFESGHSTDSTGLFDMKGYDLSESIPESEVALFSGGADSLAGVLQLLQEQDYPVALVSHQSSPQATKTQRALVQALKAQFGGRIYHFQFETNIKGQRPVEETQRTRAFLFCAIGFALAFSLKKTELKVFENGITSINLHRREDLMNARASRTTHPKAISLIQDFLGIILGNEFKISLPLLSKTKTDVINIIVGAAPGLLSSTVSCTRPSFEKESTTTHCGTCFQCVDRRLAVYAQDGPGVDLDATYSFDITETMGPNVKTIAVDFIRQALSFLREGPEILYDKYAVEVTEIIDYIPYGTTETDKIDWLWNLFRRHAKSVRDGIEKMRSLHDDVFASPPKRGSFLYMVANRDYIYTDEKLLLENIACLVNSFGEMFVTDKPNNERDFNQKLGAWLRSHDDRFRSEYPTTSFACAQVVPDHELNDADLLIEAKYIRTNTTPSATTEAIAADLTKYPKEKLILFVVYDPDHNIKSDEVYKSDIEKHGRNKVVIVR